MWNMRIFNDLAMTGSFNSSIIRRRTCNFYCLEPILPALQGLHHPKPFSILMAICSTRFLQRNPVKKFIQKFLTSHALDIWFKFTAKVFMSSLIIRRLLNIATIVVTDKYNDKTSQSFILHDRIQFQSNCESFFLYSV